MNAEQIEDAYGKCVYVGIYICATCMLIAKGYM